MSSRKRNYQWSEPWGLACSPIAITPELWYVGNRDVSCHALKTPDGVILFDTAFANTTYLLVDSLWAAGIDPRDVGLIIHSHGHEDHCGGTRRMQALTGAPVYLGERDFNTVINGTPLTCAEYTYGITNFETFIPDHAISHGDVIRFGGVDIHCHATPGHTPGCISFTFDVDVDGTPRTAGLFGGPGLWTMEDLHTAAQGYRGNRDDFRQSLKLLATLDVEVWLGAHPDQSRTFQKAEHLARGASPNPFVNPKGWKAFIAGIQEKFDGKGW
jgi:metallo-beta-lactamase class B